MPGGMAPDYSKWRILVSKRKGGRASHYGERGEERGLVNKGHAPSLAQIRRALNPKHCAIIEAGGNRLKAVFKDRSSTGKMKYWTLIFQPDRKRRSVYIVTARESNNQEIGVHKCQKGV